MSVRLYEPVSPWDYRVAVAPAPCSRPGRPGSPLSRSCWVRSFPCCRPLQVAASTATIFLPQSFEVPAGVRNRRRAQPSKPRQGRGSPPGRQIIPPRLHYA